MYTDILRCFGDAVRRKRPEKWKTNCWFLPHDNASAHRSVLVTDFFAKDNVTTLEHPLTWIQQILCMFDLADCIIVDILHVRVGGLYYCRYFSCSSWWTVLL
jgi:hypothetical protein